MQDRGGGRESKNGSLRKSKKGRAEIAKAIASTPREDRPEFPPLPPPVAPLPPSRGNDAGLPPLLDACCALCSRQFDRDREAVLRRSADAGCAAVVVFSSDVDRQREVCTLARSAPGRLYAAVGALPDNVKRTNEKQAAEWLEAVRDLALTVAEVVALQAGLNLSLPPATHHAQEGLLRAHAALAAELRLPLLLHVAPGSLARAAELLLEAPGGLARAALVHAGAHGAEELAAFAAAGGALAFSAAGVSDGGGCGAALAAAARGSALLASGAPGHTPQTLEDEYLRTLRNEPSTLPQVAADLAAGGGEAPAALRRRLWAHSLAFFGLSDGALEAAEAESAPPPAPAPAPAHAPAPPDCPPAASPPPRPAARAARARPPSPPPPPRPAAAAEPHYACRRCRRPLFPSALPQTHRAGEGGGAAAAGAEQAADDNVCLAHVFVPLPRPEELPSLALAEAEAEGERRLACAHCGAKLGRFCADGAACACGAQLAGALGKLYASRLDFVTGAEAALEGLRLRGEREAAEVEEKEDGRARGVRAKAPKPKRDNLRNLSSFRNKGS